MRQRPGANTQGQSLMVAWQDIPWQKSHRHVCRLQKRIYRATPQGRVSIARKLQKLLVQSWYARLLVVRRIRQEKRGKHTAGIAGVKALTPAARWRLVKTLRLDSQPTPLRRTWIPQRGSIENRPLGLPTQQERARQTARAPSVGTRMGGQAVAAYLWLAPRTPLLGCKRSDFPLV
jgi:RNA-directed DNA polymerase